MIVDLPGLLMQTASAELFGVYICCYVVLVLVVHAALVGDLPWGKIKT